MDRGQIQLSFRPGVVLDIMAVTWPEAIEG